MVTVASLLQIMDLVASLDSSRDLQSIYAKSFINRLHLVLHACVKIFNVTNFLCFGSLWGGKPQYSSARVAVAQK